MTGAVFAVCLLGVCQICGALVAALLIRRYIARIRADIESKITDSIRDLVSQPAPDQPSKLAQIVDAAGAVIGSAAARSIMASLSADKSHAANVAGGVADQIQAEQNPIMAILTGGKRGKNAGVLRLAQMLGPLLGGSGRPPGGQLPLLGGGNHNDSASAGSVSDRIKRKGGQ
jgi:hypothetical protein